VKTATLLPEVLGLPFTRCSLRRLVAYLCDGAERPVRVGAERAVTSVQPVLSGEVPTGRVRLSPTSRPSPTSSTQLRTLRSRPIHKILDRPRSGPQRLTVPLANLTSGGSMSFTRKCSVASWPHRSAIEPGPGYS